MPSHRRARRLVIVAGVLATLLVVSLLFFRADLLYRYHRALLIADAGYLREIATARANTPAARALEDYVNTDSGRKQLAVQVASLMLECVADPALATRVLELERWPVATLNLMRIDEGGSSDEWWVTYSTNEGGRESTGSSPAPRLLVTLSRSFAALKTLSDVLTLDAHPAYRSRLWVEDTGERQVKAHFARW